MSILCRNSAYIYIVGSECSMFLILFKKKKKKKIKITPLIPGIITINAKMHLVL